MRTVLLLLLLSSFVIAQKTSKDKKYSLGRKELGWISAWMECKKEGKRLASITNQNEQNKVEDLLKPKNSSKKQTGPPSDQYWIGSRFVSQNRKFMWTGEEFTDLTDVSFTKWETMGNQSQPDTGKCVRTTRSGQWNKQFCHERNYFICEYY